PFSMITRKRCILFSPLYLCLLDEGVEEASPSSARWACFLYFLISRAEDLYPAVGLFSPAAGDQVITRRHLVLQPSNVGIGGRQFSRRQAFIQNLVNGILGL